MWSLKIRSELARSAMVRATLGQHLKTKRFMAGLRQSQIARQIGVSCRTLNLLECDRIYPAWAFQPRIIAYLGYDPFTKTGRLDTKSNENQGVAILSQNTPASIGQKIRILRLCLFPENLS